MSIASRNKNSSFQNPEYIEAHPTEKFLLTNKNMNNNFTLLDSDNTRSPDYRTFLMMRRNMSRIPRRYSEYEDTDDTDDSDDDESEQEDDKINFPQVPNESNISLSDQSSCASSISDYECNSRKVSNDSTEMKPRLMPASNHHALLKISVTEQKLTKCLRVDVSESVWTAKQRIIQTLAKKLPDPLNYGLYCKKLGCFLLDHKPMSDYVEVNAVAAFELRYKRRVYHHVLKSPKDSRHLLKMQGASKRKELMSSVRMNNIDKIHAVLRKGVDPNFHGPSSGDTPLTLAASNQSGNNTAATFDRSRSSVIMALVGGGAHLDFRNKRGFTPIHVAVRTGNLTALKTLLELGAAPDARDGVDLTPLYHCSLLDTNTDCISHLHQQGAKLNRVNSQGWTVLHQVCRYGRLAQLKTILEIVNSSKDYADFIDAQNETGNTALHVCALYNQEICMMTLLKSNADVTIRNYAHQDAFQVAIVAGNVTLAHLVKEYPNHSDQARNLLKGDLNAKSPAISELCNQPALLMSDEPSTFRRHTITAAALSKMNKMQSLIGGTSFSRQNQPQVKSTTHVTNLSANATLPRHSLNSVPPRSIMTLTSVQPFTEKTDERQGEKDKSTPHVDLDVLYIACKDYQAKNDNELSVRIGDRIAVTTSSSGDKRSGTESYYKGRVANKSGLIPNECVQAVKLRKTKTNYDAIRELEDNLKTNKHNVNTSMTSSHASTMSDASSVTSSHDRAGLQATSQHDVFHQYRDVTVAKGSDGYGFVLRGAKSENPIDNFSPTPRHPGLQYLESVEEGSNSFKAGLRSGDFILKINNTDVTCMGHKQTVDVIRCIREPLHMHVVSVVCKEPSIDGNATKARTTSTSSRETSGSVTSSSRHTSSPTDKLSRSGSIGSAIGKLDSVIAMEDASDENTDDSTATLRRRPISRRFKSQDIQEIFLRQDPVQNPKTATAASSSSETQSLSSATSRRLIRVLPPSIPPIKSVVVDEINTPVQHDLQPPNTDVTDSLGSRSNSESSLASFGSDVMTSQVRAPTPSSFQGNRHHVTSSDPASLKKPPPPPQRRSSRLTGAVREEKPFTAHTSSLHTSSLHAAHASPHVPLATQTVGRSFVAVNHNKPTRPELSGIASAVAFVAQHRQERINSNEETPSPTSPNRLFKAPSVAPKPGRGKGDTASKPVINGDSSGALALALAAKRASLQHRPDHVADQTNSVPPSTAHKKMDDYETPREMIKLPPPPPTPPFAVVDGAPFNLPPPPPSDHHGQFSHMAFEDMLLPPPPDAMLDDTIPPPPIFAGDGKRQRKDSTNLPPSKFKDDPVSSDRYSATSNGLDSASNADSGVDEIGPHGRHHSEVKANIETLSVVSSLSTISSEEGSDVGVSLSYDPKSTADQNTGNIYLDALKKNKNNRENNDSNIVLTKVSFGKTQRATPSTNQKPQSNHVENINNTARVDVTKQPTVSNNEPVVSNKTVDKVDNKPLTDWSVGDVSKWLTDLGLGSYAQVFMENEIDGSHLPELGKEELQELGVTRVGHRLTIERSLKKLIK